MSMQSCPTLRDTLWARLTLIKTPVFRKGNGNTFNNVLPTQMFGAGTFAEFRKPLETWRSSAKVPTPNVLYGLSQSSLD